MTDPKTVTVQENARELLCQRCAREYRVWAAASPLWNAAVRGGCINGPEEFTFLCANCFMELAEDRGVASCFTVRAEHVADLQTVTPSGRVWSGKALQWEEPREVLTQLNGGRNVG